MRRRTARLLHYLGSCLSTALLVGLLGPVEVVFAQTTPTVPAVPGAPSATPGAPPAAPGSPPLTPSVPVPGPPAEEFPPAPGLPTGPRPPVPLSPPLEASPTPPPVTIPSVFPPFFLRRPLFIPPSAATVDFHPTLVLSEEYSDNFFLTPNHKQDNYRSSVSPGAAVFINFARTKGQILAAFSPTYDTALDEVSYFYSLDGRVEWEATPRLRLTASETSIRSDEPRLGDRLGLRRGRSTFTSNFFALISDYRIGNIPTQQYYNFATFSDESGLDTFTHTLGANVSPTFHRVNTATLGYEYTTSRTGGSDETGHEIRGSLARQLTTRGWAGVQANYAVRTFTGNTGGAGADYTLWGAALYSSYVIPGRWSFNSNLGYTIVSPKQGSNQSDITSGTALTYQFARALATLGFEQGFSETFRQGQNFGLVKTQGVTGSLLYPFTPLVTGVALAAYRVNQLPKDINSEQPNTTDKTLTISVLLRYQVRRWLFVDLEYDYTDASSAQRERAYRENHGRLALSAMF